MCEPVTIGFLVAGMATSMAGTIAQMQSASRAQKIAAQRFRYEQAVFENQKIAAQQEKLHEKQLEIIRQRLLSEKGARDFGDLQVAFAANGQLVNVGSAGDTTQELAGEIAFEKLLSKHESELRERNLNLEIASRDADIGLSKFGAIETKLAAKSQKIAGFFQLGETALGTARDFNIQRLKRKAPGTTKVT